MNKVRFIYATLLCLFLLQGCQTTKKDDELSLTADAKPKLLSTLEFVPKIEKDKEGFEIPYEPMMNPYIEQNSKIKKESIALFIAAKRELKSNRLDTAAKHLRSILEQDDELSGPHMLLGDIAQEQKKPEAAIEHYLKAIEVNDKNVNVYLKLAKLQREQGDFLRAQNTYTKALQMWKDFPEAHLNLAVLYDVYLNHPLRAQKHMEAYQFLTGGKNKKVAQWLAEIQQRTGVAVTLEVKKEKAVSKPLS